MCKKDKVYDINAKIDTPEGTNTVTGTVSCSTDERSECPRPKCGWEWIIGISVTALIAVTAAIVLIISIFVKVEGGNCCICSLCMYDLCICGLCVIGGIALVCLTVMCVCALVSKARIAKTVLEKSLNEELKKTIDQYISDFKK